MTSEIKCQEKAILIKIKHTLCIQSCQPIATGNTNELWENMPFRNMRTEGPAQPAHSQFDQGIHCLHTELWAMSKVQGPVV